MTKIVTFGAVGSSRPHNKLSVKELERQLRFHRIAMRQSKIAFWRWSFAKLKMTDWSDNYTDIDSLNPNKALDDDDLLEAIHPEDRETVAAVYDKAYDEEIPFDIEYRIVDKHGQHRWIHEHAEVDFNEQGRAIAFFGVLQDITQRKELEQKLESLARVDDLTGLLNRREFNQQFKQALQRTKRNGSKIALLYIDLDDFKSVNDLLGHEFGDQTLKEIASRITNELRQSDLAARIGGDEFNLLLEGKVDVDQAIEIADRLLKVLARPIKLSDDKSVCLSGSIGIAIAPDHGVSVKALTMLADKAMYQAKNSGRDQFVFASLAKPTK